MHPPAHLVSQRVVFIFLLQGRRHRTDLVEQDHGVVESDEGQMPPERAAVIPQFTSSGEDVKVRRVLVPLIHERH